MGSSYSELLERQIWKGRLFWQKRTFAEESAMPVRQEQDASKLVELGSDSVLEMAEKAGQVVFASVVVGNVAVLVEVTVREAVESLP